MPVISVNQSTALTGFGAPDAYVNIIPPQNINTVGATTNLGALVGTGSWGPLNTVFYFSDPSSLQAAVGNVTIATNDLATEASQALAFSSNLAGVRVSNGSDVAAIGVLKDTNPTPATGATLTAKYTGVVGNTITVTLAQSPFSTSGAPLVNATVQRQGFAPEFFPNIVSTATGGTFWTNFVNAINNGISGVRGPSQLITATIGSSTYPPAFASATLSGGSNGDTAVTDAELLGTDGTSRTGMYALRGTGAAVFAICGLTDVTTWPTIEAFAQSEAMLAIVTVPAGTSTTSAITDMQTNNLNSDWVKLVAESSLTIFDTLNNVQRQITPLGETVGVRAAMNPWDSMLNKPITGLTNFLQTERFGAPFSESEITQMAQAGIDAIVNPIVRGPMYGYRTGVVTSGKTDNYPVFTSFIARSIALIMGQYVGDLQGSATGDATRANARASLQHFFSTIAPYLNGAPTITLSSANNTATTVAQGLMVANISVPYLGVVSYFVANLQGGVTVSSASQTQLSNQ